MSVEAPFVVKRETLEHYLDAVNSALVALCDQDAILERGHFGKGDHEEALAKLRTVKGELKRSLDGRKARG